MKYRFEKEVPLCQEKYDFIVAGGGISGCTAAISAARKGLKVLLIEAMGCLGGMGTSGLVTAFDPMSNGEQRLVRGIMKEIVDTLYKKGFLGPQVTPDLYTKQYLKWTPYTAEGLKLVLDEMCIAENIHIKYFTKVVDVDSNLQEKTIQGVIIHNVEGFGYIPTKFLADCSGDAIVADLAGVESRTAGIDTEKPMPSTLCATLASINWEKAQDEGKIQLCGYDMPSGRQQEIIADAVDNGEFSQNDKHFPGLARTGKTLSAMNAGHIFNVNSLKIDDVTKAMIKGRKLVQEYATVFRKRFPGFENVEVVATASLLGVRESRRIVGEYELTQDDYIQKREFPDQIGVFNKFIDIHPYDCTEEALNEFKTTHKEGSLPPGTYFGLPYGILVPKGWKNLWVAGRPNSSDIAVHGAIRTMPACGMMGQAVGTAAALCKKSNQTACTLNTELLICTLREDDVFLPQTNLSTEMTRTNS